MRFRRRKQKGLTKSLNKLAKGVVDGLFFFFPLACVGVWSVFGLSCFPYCCLQYIHPKDKESLGCGLEFGLPCSPYCC